MSGELGRLAARFRAGGTPEELAAGLGRTLNAVRWKLHALGLAPFPADLLPEQRAPASASAPAPKAYSVAELREHHPNSHKRRQPAADELLAARSAQGATIEELTAEFGRNDGAIRSRLVKLDARGPAADRARAQR